MSIAPEKMEEGQKLSNFSWESVSMNVKVGKQDKKILDGSWELKFLFVFARSTISEASICQA